MWVDNNSDGVTQSGELKSLNSLSITKIDLQATTGVGIDNGNVLGLTSTYQTSDGATHAAADVWFATDKSNGAVSSAALDNSTVDKAIASLGSSVIAAESTAGVNPAVSIVNPADGQALLGTMQAPVSLEAKTDLRSQVSGLVQAIGSFASASGVGSAASAAGLDTSVGESQNSNAASMVVVSMADVMKQFDVNGNLVANTPSSAASTIKLEIAGIVDPSKSGFLATGGK